MDIKTAINEINKEYNFPGLNRLSNLIQSKYDFSKEEIIKHVQGDTNRQLVAQRPKPISQGHITALQHNELMQMDLFYMQRFKNVD